MELFNSIKNYQANNGKLALALGNFDGMHIAHQKIIRQTKHKASAAGLKSAVFLLDPHPVKLLYPHKKFPLLSALPERAEMMENLGIDYLFVEKFTAEMSALTPRQFMQDYLVDILKVREIVVGYDYTFGRQGKGTTDDLRTWGKLFNFNVDIIPPVMLGHEVVSSTLIRKLIANGQVRKAADYLGRYFARKGKVVHGEGRGQLLGFPTANLDIDAELLLPQKGVYLSLVSWRNQNIFGLTNIGNKPTFGLNEKIFVEIYLLNFNEDIYDEELTAAFLCRIRDEKAFKNIRSLKEQIEADIIIAQKLIAREYERILEKMPT